MHQMAVMKSIINKNNLDYFIAISFLMLLMIASYISGTRIIEPLFRSRLFVLSTVIFLSTAAIFFNPKKYKSIRSVFLDWAPLLLTILCYENLKHLHANNITLALGITPIDDWMIYFDRAIFGEVLPLRLEAIINPALTFCLKMSYTWVYVCMPSMVLLYFYMRNKLDVFYQIRRALVFCLVGGYILYILIPVAGPRFILQQEFTIPLGFDYPSTYVFDILRYNWDCFPSLHTAVPLLLALKTWPHCGRKVKLLLIIAICSVIFSTVYLRYHYGIDVIAGIIWAFIIARLTQPKYQVHG